MNKYKVYMIYPKMYYGGFAMVSAESADKANEIIKMFKEFGEINKEDSNGYHYVTDNDIVDGVYAEKEGFIMKEIFYRGH